LVFGIHALEGKHKKKKSKKAKKGKKETKEKKEKRLEKDRKKAEKDREREVEKKKREILQKGKKAGSDVDTYCFSNCFTRLDSNSRIPVITPPFVSTEACVCVDCTCIRAWMYIEDLQLYFSNKIKPESDYPRAWQISM